MCPGTWAPVSTSIPRLRKERATTAVTSGSHPARIESRASSDRDLGAQVREQGRELAPDRAAADHGHRRGETLEVQELVGGQDETTVDLEPRQRTGDRPRAKTMWRPVISRAGVGAVDDAAPGRPPSKVPVPFKIVTCRRLRSPDRPLKSWSTTALLRAWLTAKSTWRHRQR